MRPLNLALVLTVAVSACKPQDAQRANFFVKWSMPSPQQSQFTPQGTGWTPAGTVKVMLMFEPARPADDGDNPLQRGLVHAWSLLNRRWWWKLATRYSAFLSCRISNPEGLGDQSRGMPVQKTSR